MVNILHILRDSFWQGVGTLVTIGTGVLALVQSKRLRKSKQLLCRTVSQSSVISGDKDLRGRVEITFDRQPVRNLCIVDICIANSGNISIPATNYEEPLVLKFDSMAQILSADVVDFAPKQLNVSLTIAKSTVTVRNLLLNAGDNYTVRICVDLPIHTPALVTGQCYEIAGRIEGIKEIVIEPFIKQPLSGVKQKWSKLILFIKTDVWKKKRSVASQPVYSVTQPIITDTNIPPLHQPTLQQVILSAPAKQPKVKEHAYIAETKLNELPPKEQGRLLSEAKQWVREHNSSSDNDLLMKNVAIGLWRQEQRAKWKISQEYFAKKPPIETADVPDDVQKARTRLPNEASKE